MRLVVFDLDGTLWDHPDASSLKPPLRLVDLSSVVDSTGVMLRLYPGARKALSMLRRNGLLLAVASWNESWVASILDALGLTDYFDLIEIHPSPRKELMILRMLRKAERMGFLGLGLRTSCTLMTGTSTSRTLGGL